MESSGCLLMLFSKPLLIQLADAVSLGEDALRSLAQSLCAGGVAVEDSGLQVVEQTL